MSAIVSRRSLLGWLAALPFAAPAAEAAAHAAAFASPLVDAGFDVAFWTFQKGTVILKRVMVRPAGEMFDPDKLMALRP